MRLSYRRAPSLVLALALVGSASAAARRTAGLDHPRGVVAGGNTVAVAAPAPSSGAVRPTRLFTYDAQDNITAYCDPYATHSLGADWTTYSTTLRGENHAYVTASTGGLLPKSVRDASARRNRQTEGMSGVHAELKGLEMARKNGDIAIGIGASRWVCTKCELVLQANNVKYAPSRALGKIP